MMNSEQIEVIAEGLYHLAACDGVDESEVRVIRDFLNEAGAPPETLERLGKGEFDADQLEWHLNTQYLRRIFIKACWVIVKADGKVTDKERELIREFAAVVGEEEHLADLEKDVAGVKL